MRWTVRQLVLKRHRAWCGWRFQLSPGSGCDHSHLTHFSGFLPNFNRILRLASMGFIFICRAVNCKGIPTIPVHASFLYGNGASGFWLVGGWNCFDHNGDFAGAVLSFVGWIHAAVIQLNITSPSTNFFRLLALLHYYSLSQLVSVVLLLVVYRTITLIEQNRRRCSNCHLLKLPITHVSSSKFIVSIIGNLQLTLMLCHINTKKHWAIIETLWEFYVSYSRVFHSNSQLALNFAVLVEVGINAHLAYSIYETNFWESQAKFNFSLCCHWAFLPSSIPFLPSSFLLPSIPIFFSSVHSSSFFSVFSISSQSFNFQAFEYFSVLSHRVLECHRTITVCQNQFGHRFVQTCAGETTSSPSCTWHWCSWFPPTDQ